MLAEATIMADAIASGERVDQVSATVEAADGDAARVEKKMPRRVKRKRAIFADDGAPAGQEEYYDYIFPEEQGAAPNLKILEAAYAWKKRRTE